MGREVGLITRDRSVQTFVSPMLSLALVTSEAINTLNTLADRHEDSKSDHASPDLNQQLETWRRSLPHPIRPLYGDDGQLELRNPAQICLQICYYQVLLLINRASLTSHLEPVQGSGIGIEKSQGFRICVDAARETIRLVKNIPVAFEGFMRLVNYKPHP